MSVQQEKDNALEKAGKILIAAFGNMYGKISFNLQGNRKTVHSNIVHEVNVEIAENKQFIADGEGHIGKPWNGIVPVGPNSGRPKNPNKLDERK